MALCLLGHYRLQILEFVCLKIINGFEYTTPLYLYFLDHTWFRTKVHLPNLLANTFRPNFLIFWLRDLKLDKRPSLLMLLKIFRSILGFGSFGSRKHGISRGFQGPKIEIISSKIANFNFLALRPTKPAPFCGAK